jgi:protein SCO1/2
MSTQAHPEAAKAPLLRAWSVQNFRAALFVIVVVGLAVLGSIFAWLGNGVTGPNIGGHYTLTDDKNQTVTYRSWPEKYLLMYFGYTFCPDVCPTTLNNIVGALDQLGPLADRVQPLFITIDPRRDTPALMASYASAFSPRLIGLTGTADQIAHIATEFHVYYARHRTGPGPDDYSMDHGSIVYLMAPDGHFLSTISGEQSPAGMASEMARLLR